MAETSKTIQAGRLALRHEGRLWNAYYAMPDTMEGAILIGSVEMRFVAVNKARKDAFMQLMQECVGDVIEEATGVRPTWPEPAKRAPERERAGHS